MLRVSASTFITKGLSRVVRRRQRVNHRDLGVSFDYLVPGVYNGMYRRDLSLLVVGSTMCPAPTQWENKVTFGAEQVQNLLRGRRDMR